MRHPVVSQAHRPSIRHRAIAVAACALAAGAPLRAADWAAPDTGLWTDPARWTGNDVPDTDAEAGAISTTGAAHVVTLDSPLTVAQLTLNSADATLTLDQDLQIGTTVAPGSVTFAGGAINGSGTITIYGGPLEIGASGPGGPSGGSFTLISHSSIAINRIAGTGGDVLAGMSARVLPQQDASTSILTLHSAFANHGTLEITPSLDNPVAQVQASASFTNAGTLITHVNAAGNGATGFFSSSFINDTAGIAQFGTSAFFTGTNVTNRGSMTVAAGNYFMQASLRFTQVSGDLDVGLSLFAPIFEYQGGTIAGPVDTNQLLIAPSVSTGTFRLSSYVNAHATIGQSAGTGGDIPAGVSVSADGDDVTGIAVRTIFINEGTLSIAQNAGNDVFLSTHGMVGDGQFINRGVYNVTAEDAVNEHTVHGDLINDIAGSASFTSNVAVTEHLTNHGAIAMSGGHTLSVSGDFTQSNTGTLGIELGGAVFDRIEITGAAALAGTLDISLADGFDPIAAPPEEQTFQIMIFASTAGEFDDVSGKYVDNGYFWDVSYNPADVTLSLVQAGPGDTDLDGDVDLVDLGTLATYYDQPGVFDWINGDFDHDGDVDLVDLGTLATYYSSGESQAFADFQSLASIPEPSAIAMGAFSVLAMSARRRRRAVSRSQPAQKLLDGHITLG